MLKKLPFKGYIYSAIILDLLTTLVIFLVKGNLPPIVPLFYGKPVGSAQLVTTYALVVAPGAAVVITILNVVLASYVKDEFLKKILSVSSFFVSVLAAITVIKIIFLVSF